LVLELTVAKFGKIVKLGNLALILSVGKAGRRGGRRVGEGEWGE